MQPNNLGQPVNLEQPPSEGALVRFGRPLARVAFAGAAVLTLGNLYYAGVHDSRARVAVEHGDAAKAAAELSERTNNLSDAVLPPSGLVGMLAASSLAFRKKR